MHVGVLALQGAVAPHIKKLNELGATPVEVRVARDLENLSGLIIPGGESTTFNLLLKKNHLWQPLAAFSRQKPTWGICAGAILLAKDVSAPVQESLGSIDIAIKRNGYGRQLQSFITELEAGDDWDESRLEAVFIRAPIIETQSHQVKTILTYEDQPVMVQQDNVLAATFHPELTNSLAVHRYFLRQMAH